MTAPLCIDCVSIDPHHEAKRQLIDCLYFSSKMYCTIHYVWWKGGAAGGLKFFMRPKHVNFPAPPNMLKLFPYIWDMLYILT